MPLTQNAVGLLRQPFIKTAGQIELSVAPSFDGFAVVQLKSLTEVPPPEKPKRGTVPPWYEIVVVSRQKLIVDVTSAEAFVVDFEDGFDASPGAVWLFARQYVLLKGTGAAAPAAAARPKAPGTLTVPGDCPIVT